MTPKSLPNNAEAEQIVLGGIISDYSGEGLDIFMSLSANHFFQKCNKRIFLVMKDLHAEGKPITVLAITDRLQGMGQLEDIGGAYYLSGLARSFAPISIVQESVEIIRSKYALREMVQICDSLMKRAYSQEDPKDIITDFEGKVFDLTSSDKTFGQNVAPQGLEAVMEQINNRKQGIKQTWLATGIGCFDRIFGGLQPSTYNVIAGRPSAGKTAFADQSVVDLVLRGESVLYIALESSVSRIMGKLACKMAKVSFFRFNRGFCTPQELEAIEAAVNFLSRSKLFIIQQNDITGADIRSLVRKWKRQAGISVFVLDYLQNVVSKKHTDERLAIAEASDQIQKACIETGVPGLILAQIQRSVEIGDRPSMSNLKGSGDIEQDADTIVVLWNPIDPRQVPTDQLIPVTMSVEKQKDGERGFDHEMFFNGPLLTFEEKPREIPSEKKSAK